MSSQSISNDMDIDPIAPLNEPYQPFDYEDYDEDEADYEKEFHPEETSIGSNLVGKKKRGGNRRQPSIVWSHLTKFEKTLEDGSFYPYAKCNTCSSELLTHSQRNRTSSLKAHLQRCVGSPLFINHAGSQTMLSGALVVHKFEQKRLDLKLVSWTICAKLPFKTVEHHKFKELFAEAQPKYKVPCRKTITKGVPELFFGEKEKMRQ